jgi:hypothetical protein
MASTWNFRLHQSHSLRWKWHLQDFKVLSAAGSASGDFVVMVRPKYRTMIRLLRIARRARLPVTTLSAIRLGSIASIMASGWTLGKASKDAECIAKEMSVSCHAPLIYDENTMIPIRVRTRVLKSTDRFTVMSCAFEIGAGRQHFGQVLHFYCRPGLTNFSYL